MAGKNRSSSARRYALPLVATAVALAATWILRRDGPTPSFLFFVPAVAISAWAGGPGPSALATLLSLVLIDLNFLAPGGSFRIDRVEGLEIIAFLIVSATVTATMEALHRSQSVAEAQAEELRRLNAEVAQRYDAERERRREAELLARAREDVLGVVAHDLRNPLNLISTTTDLMLEENLEAERGRQMLAVAKRAAMQMNRLIGDLLDTARLQSGKYALEKEDIAIGSILRQAVETFSPAASARNVRLDVAQVDGDLAVRADPLRVSQIVGNLVGNAIKFTPEHGTVSVTVGTRGNDAVFCVRDTGPGILPEHMDHLFDNFWQARSDDHRGVGLGLAIAKALVEAHGGTIWCESRPGDGAAFFFTLPLAPR